MNVGEYVRGACVRKNGISVHVHLTLLWRYDEHIIIDRK